jgi:hypothetical protein
MISTTLFIAENGKMSMIHVIRFRNMIIEINLQLKMQLNKSLNGLWFLMKDFILRSKDVAFLQNLIQKNTVTFNY